MANDARRATRRTAEPDGREKKFIGVATLAERWGCSEMTIENMIKGHERFRATCPIYVFGRTRKFDLDDVEAFERASVVARREVETAA